MLRAQRPMAYYDWLNEHEGHLLDAWEALQRLERANIYIFDQYACPFHRFCELAYAHSSIPESWVGGGGGGSTDDDSPTDE